MIARKNVPDVITHNELEAEILNIKSNKSRDVTRTLIGGVNIHIVMFCPTNFFSN